MLIPLLHDEPPTLLVAEIKFRRGSGFGCLLIWRLDRPEVLPALSDDRQFAASWWCASFSGLSCRNHVAWSRREPVAAIEIACNYLVQHGCDMVSGLKAKRLI
jgi:hypothetical protein